MKMIFEEVRPLETGVWLAPVPPHEVQLLGQPKTTLGPQSVLLAEAAIYDSTNDTLTCEAGGMIPLNLGTGPNTIIVSCQDPGRGASDDTGKPAGQPSHGFGVGDRAYLQLVESELDGNAREAAVQILQEVRSRYPGDLQRGQSRNFKNTPDNFWYVIVQPRAQNLSITVRGVPSRFNSSKLTLKADRPGYTRFALSHPSEVAEALKIIEQSKRK